MAERSCYWCDRPVTDRAHGSWKITGIYCTKHCLAAALDFVERDDGERQTMIDAAEAEYGIRD